GNKKVDDLASDWTPGEWVIFRSDARYWLGTADANATPIPYRVIDQAGRSESKPATANYLYLKRSVRRPRATEDDRYVICATDKQYPLFILPTPTGEGSNMVRRVYVLLTTQDVSADGKL